MGITQDYLSKAKTHLELLVTRPDGWNCHGFMLARVKYLLGDSNAGVENTFRIAIERKNEDRKKVELIQHFGWFYGMIGDTDNAKVYFDRAIEAWPRLKYRPHLAEKGLRLLRQGRPLYPS